MSVSVGPLAPVNSHRSLVDVRSRARHHVRHLHAALLGRPVERRLQHTHTNTPAVNHSIDVNHIADVFRLRCPPGLNKTALKSLFLIYNDYNDTEQFCLL